MKNANFYVYCHTTPSNRKYVGISCNPEKRWNSGRGYIKNYLFYRAIEKYGWDNIEHTILFENLTADEAKEIEIKLVKEWNLTDPKCGFNLRDGGDGSFSEHSRELMSKSRMGNQNTKGKKLSAEARKKISSSLSEYYKTHKPTFAGRHHSAKTIERLRTRTFSEETRTKMSKSHADVSGKNNPSAKPVIQLSLSGEVIEEYDYAKLAAKKYNLDLSSIIKCCRGKQKTCGGFRWAYKH